MQAVLVGEEGVSVVQDHPIPVPEPGEALIRIIRIGICNTDLEIMKGYAGFTGVMGHEFLGKVESVAALNGSFPKLKVGDRVVGEINISKPNCDCPRCKEGGPSQRNHCMNRQVLGIRDKDGTFAEFITLPTNNLLVIPPSVSDERATFAEPLAAAFRIVEQRAVKKNDCVAVIGDGKLGLLIAMVMKLQPIRSLTIFGKHPDKMAALPVSFNGGNVVDHECVVVDESTGTKYADHFDVTIEASGTASGIMMAASITRSLGTVVLKTTCAAGADNFNSSLFVVKELTIVGSRCGCFKMALKALEAGLPVEKLISKTYQFGEVERAIDHAGSKGTLKIQVII